MHRFARTRAAAVLALVGTNVGCLTTIENSLVFHPTHTGYPGVTKTTFPEDVEILTNDGLRLHGWYREVANPKAIVLYLHGNAGNVTACSEAIKGFNERGASILVVDYRGFGRSEGEPSEAGILADARAARRWLAKRARVEEKEIVLVGYSLGGGVAVDLARDGARGLVLESTFTSLPDVAERHFPLLPVHWLMSTQLDSRAKIARYKGPLLQTHGDADTIVPYDLGRQLFHAANEPKRFVPIPGGGHSDLWGSPVGQPYRDALSSFLDTLP